MKRLNSAVLISLLSLLICLGSCENRINNELTEQEKQHIIQEIDQLSEELWEAWNSRDYAKYMDYYVNRGDYTFAANGFIVRGWDTFYDTVNVHTAYYSRAEVKTVRKYIDVINRDVVIVHQLYDWDATYKQGGEEKLTCTYTTIYVRIDGEWKIISTSESCPGQF
jgi:uncharacterized protein (TIGR02246 family)